MGAPQGTSVSNTPTGASPGLDAGDNGVVPVRDNVIGSDATIESAKLEPLKPEAISTSATTSAEDASKGVASVLDGLAASQPAKTAGDLIGQATGELRRAYFILAGWRLIAFVSLPRPRQPGIRGRCRKEIERIRLRSPSYLGDFCLDCIDRCAYYNKDRPLVPNHISVSFQRPLKGLVIAETADCCRLVTC